MGGASQKMDFKLIEPLRELFKDEVRALGYELGMPDEFIRDILSGPGLAIRCIGKVLKKTNILRKADYIFSIK